MHLVLISIAAPMKANVPGSPAAVSFEEHQSRWNKANKASKNSTRFVGDGSGAEEAMERI